MNGQAPYACPAALKIPLFFRIRGFLVCPDGGAIEKGHPQLDAIALLRPFQQTLPDTMAAPADEGLRRHPPRPQMRWNTAPFRAVVVPPDDRFDGAAEVVVLRFVRRAALFDQWRQFVALSVGQNAVASFVCHALNIAIDLRG